MWDENLPLGESVPVRVRLMVFVMYLSHDYGFMYMSSFLKYLFIQWEVYGFSDLRLANWI